MKLHIPVLGLMLGLSFHSQAADIKEGKALVDKNCQNCHGTEVYARKDRKVKSLKGLKKQVRRCELALGLSWFDKQIDNASAHLNEGFYHFK